MPSISSSFAQAFFDAVQPAIAHEQKVPNPFAAQASGLSAAMQQIPLQDLTAFLALVERMGSNPDIGLLAYEKAHPGNLGVLGYAIMSSSTVREALRYIVDFHSLIGSGFCMFLDEQPDTIKMVGFAEDLRDAALPRLFIDAVASITLGLLHWLVGDKKIVPIAAEFTYSQPADTCELEKLFGPTLKFAAEVNSLTFRHEDAELPIATGDLLLQGIHNDYLTMQQRQLVADRMSVWTKSTLLRHLYQKLPVTIDEVASTMKLTSHQLIQALESEGHSFKKLLDHVKAQKSQLLLTGTDLSLKQISYRLGFKNQSAFNKACERWFGMSPGRYRDCKRVPASHVTG